MLKTLIPLMTLALLWGPAATAANPSDPMPDATTTTMATADTPLDHSCPCLTDHDCEVPTMQTEAPTLLDGLVARTELNDMHPAARVALNANALSLRYLGAPVYLVGGALTDADPRDVDIVVVMPDQDFWRAYGFPDGTLAEWRTGSVMADPPRIWRRWARDCLKQSRALTEYIGGPIVDFKTQPESYAKAYEGRPRRLLSTGVGAHSEDVSVRDKATS